MKTAIQEVHWMFSATMDAHSFKRYGPAGWRSAIRAIKAEVKDDRHVEAFLRSKHMRWASDASDRPHGSETGDTIRSYIAEHPECVGKAELDALTY